MKIRKELMMAGGGIESKRKEIIMGRIREKRDGK